VYFEHKVRSVDFENKAMTIYDAIQSQELHVRFDLCVGADGSYSTIRRQMMRVVRYCPSFLSGSRVIVTKKLFRMDYQQEYIKHEYIELRMPAGTDKEGCPAFLLDPNHLHIWPRKSFMLIALPNKVCEILELGHFF